LGFAKRALWATQAPLSKHGAALFPLFEFRFSNFVFSVFLPFEFRLSFSISLTLRARSRILNW